MKKLIYTILFCSTILIGYSQNIEYTEYKLDNGLHVILHQDNSAPVIATEVMYHIGSKDEIKGKSGFSHFFEHMCASSSANSPNIAKREWKQIISSKGGVANASTWKDRTNYFNFFPSNNLELAIWLQSERMLHAIIDQDQVDTQNEVVKEEKRDRIDNAPYAKLNYREIDKYMFTNHPYGQSVIGSFEDLDSASLEEFQEFYKKWYNPNNAVLVIAGDLEIEKTKKLIESYFGDIQNNNPKPSKPNIIQEPITEMIKVTEYDANIEIPAKIFSYITPRNSAKDSYVLNYISQVLTGGKSSRLYKKMVDEDKTALQVFSYGRYDQDYGTFSFFALPLGETSLEVLSDEMDSQIKRLQTELISEREFEKIKNQVETAFVQKNTSILGITSSLASYYLLYDNTSLINDEIEIYRSITREDIKEVANKYLNPNQRLDMDYVKKQ